MVSKIMFNKIKSLQRQGYNITGISKELSLDRKTIHKYFYMSEKRYKQYLFKLTNRVKIFDQYVSDILEIYEANNNKKLNTVSVYDFLEEKHGQLPASERSLRNYIHYLIMTEKLVFNKSTRMYTKVDELPYGKQMQLDFGEYKINPELKLYIFAAVLSSSRYKYVCFQDKPFKTKDIILHLLDCFDYFGGITEEIAIDQDKLMVVSENKGDIIYTKDFDYFKKEMNFKMFVCRKADPESKGKIENVIKYVKYNFLQTRDFKDIESANNSVKKWLSRRGNGKIHQTTKMIPAELIDNERKYLNKIKNSIFRVNTLIGREERDVNNKSYISVNASQYSVPAKFKNKKVEIFITENKLFIFNSLTGTQIAEHILALIPGEKLTNREHFREKSKKSGELKEMVKNMFDLENWNIFIKNNHENYQRYIRDQCIEAKKHFMYKDVDIELLDLALIFCIKSKTFSFSNLKDTYNYYLNEGKPEDINVVIPHKISDRKQEIINVKKSNLEIYNSICN